MNVKTRINKNREVFDKLCNAALVLAKSNHFNEAIIIIKEAASYAAKTETGYWNSDILENTLDIISRSIIPKPSSPVKICRKDQKILHIVSKVFFIGGHSKLLSQWIKRDDQHKSYVVATSMDLKDLKKVIDYYELDDVISMTLEGDEITKAIQLADIASSFDKIVLHIHQDDIIPSLALSKEVECKNIYFMNHADHNFWVGKNILNTFFKHGI